MLRLPSFELRLPKTLDEAAKILADAPDTTRLVAGGTDLWPNMKRRHQSADVVVGLRLVDGVRGREGDGSGETTIGGMSTLTQIVRDPVLQAAYPGLVRAVASISTPVLRNMGTIGGNLCLDTRCTYYNQNEEWRRSINYCMKEAGEVCWVAPGSPRCWAVSSSDAAPLLCAIGAEVELNSVAGRRRIPLAELYQDDGIVYLTKGRDEILERLILPPADGFKSTYWKLRRRGSIDFPVLGVGAAVWCDDAGIVTDAKIFLGGVHSYPVHAEASSKALIGFKLSDETIDEAARLAKKPAIPMDNTDFVVNWRKQMVESYVGGALREIAGLPTNCTPPKDGLWLF